MEYEFLMPESELPESFIYPASYLKYVDGDFPEFEPWHFFHGHLVFRFRGLKERYPNRTLVPFARRNDNDDVACFDASKPSENPSVIIIHDFASEGWEGRGTCKDFLDWVRLAKEEAIEWHDYWKEKSKQLKLLSKTISHALRHEPWLYELELDSNGWVLVEDLLISLQRWNNYWINLREIDLIDIIAGFEKQRFEIKDNKIRAVYGHSTPIKLKKESSQPPDVLYHGTSPEIAEIIIREGLKPVTRHYVHLSVDIETAEKVGYRKSNNPKILIIRSKMAYDNQVKFYMGNEHVWLADFIPPKYIDISS